MITEIDIVLNPKQASDESFYKPILAQKLNIKVGRINEIQILRKSIDARRRDIKINMKFRVAVDEKLPVAKELIFDYPNVMDKKKVIVVGAGPAGLFAALKLIEQGIKPIIYR